jgi:hypothetical protein
LDTMGIYWTMKYANMKDKEILREWGIRRAPLGYHDLHPRRILQ